MNEFEEKIEARVEARRKAIQNKLRPKSSAPVHRPPFGLVSPGENRDGKFITLPERNRSMHMHVIGATGKGKTNTLEHMIRQDILYGHGVCVIDPHGGHKGSLYNNLLRWMDETGVARNRTIHLLDPSDENFITGFNPVRRPVGVDVSVIADAALEAFERAWGDEETRKTPRIRRVLTATFSLLAEQNLTLADATLFLDPEDRHGYREHLLKMLDDLYTREVWDDLHWMAENSGNDFRNYIEGPLNRLAEFTRSKAIRTMVGQTGNVIDFKQAMDEGHIVLANLQGGDVASPKATRLLGTLIVRDLFENCKRRDNPDRPFYLYIDECHQYLSGDIPAILDQARKFGLHAVLSHQRLGQLQEAGSDIFNALTSCTYVKLIMGGLSIEEAVLMADENIPLDIDRPVETLTKPTVVGHKRTELSSRSEANARSTTRTTGTSETTSEAVGTSETHGTGISSGTSDGTSIQLDDGLISNDQVGLTTRSDGKFGAESHTKSFGESNTSVTSSTRSESLGTTSGTTRTTGINETLEPVLEDRPTAVYGLETMRYVAARGLRDLDIGKACVAMGKQVEIVKVPYVEPVTGNTELPEYKRQLYRHSGSALPFPEAMGLIKTRWNKLKAAVREKREQERVEKEDDFDAWD